MGKEKTCFEFFGDGLMIGKLCSVVACNSVNVVQIAGKHARDCFGEFFRIFAVFKFFHHHECGFSLNHRNNRALAVFTDNGIYFPIAKTALFINDFRALIY